LYKGYKKKKGVMIQVDEKKGHLYLSSEESPRLLMVRPIDLIEFAEFAGANAEDIIIWVGKTIGKYFLEKSELAEQDLSSESLHEKKLKLLDLIEILKELGYGLITLTCKKSEIYFAVQDPLSENERDNIMAKNICILYQGLFSGILDYLDIDADGHEEHCYLRGDEACVFKYDLLIDEFDDEDIDEDQKESEGITGFLTSL